MSSPRAWSSDTPPTAGSEETPCCRLGSSPDAPAAHPFGLCFCETEVFFNGAGLASPPWKPDTRTELDRVKELSYS
uniref:Uncharacterized protein n=1 Tax=Setaria viridis TaxID=4556 RepID=A0A4U6V9S1_SETVI|nr:hypothetical protein SEVIR_3G098033v2 [Setaria viridis]